MSYNLLDVLIGIVAVSAALTALLGGGPARPLAKVVKNKVT